jgi:DNA repair ATPase RecN
MNDYTKLIEQTQNNIDNCHFEEMTGKPCHVCNHNKNIVAALRDLTAELNNHDYKLGKTVKELQAKVEELEAELKTIRDIIGACNTAEEMTKKLDKKYPALLEAEIEFMKSHWINPTGED